MTGAGSASDRATADVRDEDVDPNLVLREDPREAQRDATEQRGLLEHLDLAEVATVFAAQDGLFEKNGLLLHDQPMFPNGIAATTSAAP